MIAIDRPGPDEYLPYYAGYMNLVPETDILGALAAQPAAMIAWAASVPADMEAYRYAPGKWSPRQVLGHVNDGERVFGYRAFAIGRGDTASLPGYDEQEYMAHSRFDERSLSDLAAEFAHLRGANLLALRTFVDADWSRIGTANGAPASTRALAWIMVGHARNHLGVLAERYGLAAPVTGG